MVNWPGRLVLWLYDRWLCFQWNTGMVKEHRWSGWPGAWCLDCGAEDPCEIALADNEIDYVEDPSAPDGIRIEYKPGVWRRIRRLSACPEPGSNRHNPYTRNDGEGPEGE